MGQKQRYLSTDPNAGAPLRGAYLSTDPNAGEPREGESLRGLSATEAFLGPHVPINESGQPLGERGFLDTHVNPALQGAAHPQTLGDFTSLLVPSMVPELRAPFANMLREGLDAAKKAPSLARTPKAVMGRLVDWAFASGDELAREAVRKRTMAPRLAGKAPTVNEALIGALDEARAGAKPQSVALPGGDTVRVSGPVPTPNVSMAPSLPVPKPRMGAHSSQPTPASAAPPATPSAVSAPAPSVPPSSAPLRLTPQESQALRDLVAEGYDEADVIQEIARRRPAAQPSVAPKASGKPSLNAAESKEYQRLLSRGKTPEQAMTIIEQQRSFVQTKGLPTSEETRRAVVDRNETGRWRD